MPSRLLESILAQPAESSSLMVAERQFGWFKLFYRCSDEERTLTEHGYVEALPEDARLVVGREFLALGERKARGSSAEVQLGQKTDGTNQEPISN